MEHLTAFGNKGLVKSRGSGNSRNCKSSPFSYSYLWRVSFLRWLSERPRVFPSDFGSFATSGTWTERMHLRIFRIYSFTWRLKEHGSKFFLWSKAPEREEKDPINLSVFADLDYHIRQVCWEAEACEVRFSSRRRSPIFSWRSTQRTKFLAWPLFWMYSLFLEYFRFILWNDSFWMHDEGACTSVNFGVWLIVWRQARCKLTLDLEFNFLPQGARWFAEQRGLSLHKFTFSLSHLVLHKLPVSVRYFF